MKQTILLAAALLLAAPAVQAQQPDTIPIATANMPPELVRVLRDYETAWRTGQARDLAQLFHADGFALPSGVPPVHGRPDIEAHYPSTSGDLQLRGLAFATADTVGYIVGVFRYADGPESGKFLLALRRARAADPWLIAADMDNSNFRRPR